MWDFPVDGALHELAQRSGTEFARLAEARDATRRLVPQRAAAVAELTLPADSTLCLMGSWGRREVVDGSDADWLLIGDEPAGDPALLARLRERIEGGGTAAPGEEGIFGVHVAREELITQIGLDRDHNRNLTRRILLLLESVALSGAGYHARLREDLLARYVDEQVRDYRVPRFLQNDVVRYWRTICVDFAGKQQKHGGEGWGLRNAKLRLSRKLLFASGLLPTLLCVRFPRAEMRTLLAEQLAAPATDRVAYAFLAARAVDAGARALAAYDRFVALLGDPDVRAELKALRREQADDSPLFREVRGLGITLQDALVALLFETPLFGRTAREYGVL